MSRMFARLLDVTHPIEEQQSFLAGGGGVSLMEEGEEREALSLSSSIMDSSSLLSLAWPAGAAVQAAFGGMGVPLHLQQQLLAEQALQRQQLQRQQMQATGWAALSPLSQQSMGGFPATSSAAGAMLPLSPHQQHLQNQRRLLQGGVFQQTVREIDKQLLRLHQADVSAMVDAQQQQQQQEGAERQSWPSPWKSPPHSAQSSSYTTSSPLQQSQRPSLLAGSPSGAAGAGWKGMKLKSALASAGSSTLAGSTLGQARSPLQQHAAGALVPMDSVISELPSFDSVASSVVGSAAAAAAAAAQGLGDSRGGWGAAGTGSTASPSQQSSLLQHKGLQTKPFTGSPLGASLARGKGLGASATVAALLQPASSAGFALPGRSGMSAGTAASGSLFSSGSALLTAGSEAQAQQQLLAAGAGSLLAATAGAAFSNSPSPSLNGPAPNQDVFSYHALTSALGQYPGPGGTAGECGLYPGTVFLSSQSSSALQLEAGGSQQQQQQHEWEGGAGAGSEGELNVGQSILEQSSLAGSIGTGGISQQPSVSGAEKDRPALGAGQAQQKDYFAVVERLKSSQVLTSKRHERQVLGVQADSVGLGAGAYNTSKQQQSRPGKEQGYSPLAGSIYYAREVLTYSLDGHEVDLITITSNDGILLPSRLPSMVYEGFQAPPSRQSRTSHSRSRSRSRERSRERSRSRSRSGSPSPRNTRGNINSMTEPLFPEGWDGNGSTDPAAAAAAPAASPTPAGPSLSPNGRALFGSVTSPPPLTTELDSSGSKIIHYDMAGMATSIESIGEISLSPPISPLHSHTHSPALSRSPSRSRSASPGHAPRGKADSSISLPSPAGSSFPDTLVIKTLTAGQGATLSPPVAPNTLSHSSPQSHFGASGAGLASTSSMAASDILSPGAEEAGRRAAATAARRRGRSSTGRGGKDGSRGGSRGQKDGKRKEERPQEPAWTEPSQPSFQSREPNPEDVFGLRQPLIRDIFPAAVQVDEAVSLLAELEKKAKRKALRKAQAAAVGGKNGPSLSLSADAAVTRNISKSAVEGEKAGEEGEGAAAAGHPSFSGVPRPASRTGFFSAPAPKPKLPPSPPCVFPRPIAHGFATAVTNANASAAKKKLAEAEAAAGEGYRFSRSGAFEDNVFNRLPEVTIRPHAFQASKQVVLITCRVHPGETPASYSLEGLLQFLLRPDDPRSQRLRSMFVFVIIPMLNPDGVVRGHFRLDGKGVNLNRRWGDPRMDKEPTIFAAKVSVGGLQEGVLTDCCV